ncbi:cupin domain-containing protein [Candidatus Bathyarchaeota archaeon]|nr:cupin domain-containing protein [Candidatus Bathyarchaeota archaeon]
MKTGYELRKSREFIGELYPVLLDASGKFVIDGVHRLKANPNWRAERLENIKDQKQVLVARIIANLCRREVPILERCMMFENLAWYLKEVEKLDSSNIAKEISRLTGVAYRTVCRYLPEKYKDKDKVQLRRLRDSKRINSASKRLIYIDSIPSYETPQPNKQEIKVIFSSNSPKLATIIETALYPKNSTTLHLHYDSNEFAYIQEGNGKCVIKDDVISIRPKTIVLCPMETPHQYINTGHTALKITYIYTPPLNLKSNVDFYKAYEKCK